MKVDDIHSLQGTPHILTALALILFIPKTLAFSSTKTVNMESYRIICDPVAFIANELINLVSTISRTKDTRINFDE